MATTIVTKSGSGAPTASDLVAGELAVDLTNGRLYTEDSGGTVLELGLNPNGNVNVTGTVTADGTASSSVPKYTFAGDVNTGLAYIGADAVGLLAAGSRKFYVNATTGYFQNLSGGVNFGSGIDVTGTVTADGLTVNGTGSIVALSDNAVFNVNVSGGTSKTSTINQRAKSSNGSNADTSIVVTGSSGEAVSSWDFKLDTANGALTKAMSIDGSGDISFYEDTGTTPKFFWDSSAESLGIGTSSPSSSLTTEADSGVLVTDASGLRQIEIVPPQTSNGFVGEMGTRSSHPLVFNTVNTERMRIDASGSVGIGVVPSAWHASWKALQIGPIGFVGSYQAGTTDITALGSNVYSDGAYKYIETDEAVIYKQQNGTHIFDVAPSGTADAAISWTTAMTIDNSANLLVGKTSVAFSTAGIELKADNVISVTRSAGTCINANRIGSSAGSLIIMHYDGVDVGSIDVTASATSYTTSSDQRLKENIADADDAGSKIDAIQVRKFDWKVDGSHQDYGMVAQELQTVAPEAVSQGETEDDMMGVDYSKLVPMMLKEIQSLRARVAALES